MKKILISAALALGMSMSAQADPITVGGVTWDPDAGSDFTAGGLVYESFAAGVGSSVTGYGKIDTVNNTNETVFCSGCELTFDFNFLLTKSQNTQAVFSSGNTILTTTVVEWNGATAITTVNVSTVFGEDITALFDSSEFDFEFDNATLNFWKDDLKDFSGDFPKLNQANNGVLWLSLVNNGPITGTANDLFTLESIKGDGFGYLNAVGGAALGEFDTNSFVDANNADMAFDSSFLKNIGANPEVGFPLSGSISFRGTSVSEPSTIALLGLTLIGIGAASRRKKAK